VFDCSLNTLFSRGVEYWSSNLPEVCGTLRGKCFFVENIFPAQKNVHFIIQNMFDSTQLSTMGLTAQSNNTALVVAALKSSLASVDNVFVPDCYGHGFLDNRGFSRVTIRKTSVTSALQGILQQAQGVSDVRVYLQDSCESLDCNPTCANYSSHNSL